MLGAIRCVTVCAPELDLVEKTYRDVFAYSVAGRSHVTGQQAQAWNAPAMAGAPVLLMRPEAGDDFHFRFIQRPAAADYVPLTTWGWNAAELMVKNVDAMVERIDGSAFQIVGEPRDLSFCSDIRAMQVRGPGNEIIYLTEFKKEVPGLDVPTARSMVDRAFIVIVGGDSMEALQAYYNRCFQVPRAPVVQSRITMLSKALGSSVETLYPIAALALEGQSLIEVDEMPYGVGQRRSEPGLLPPGIALVSFDCSGIPADCRPIESHDPPYFGRRAAVTSGAAGELIELLDPNSANA